MKNVLFTIIALLSVAGLIAQKQTSYAPNQLIVKLKTKSNFSTETIVKEKKLISVN